MTWNTVVKPDGLLPGADLVDLGDDGEGVIAAGVKEAAKNEYHAGRSGPLRMGTALVTAGPSQI